MATEFDMSRTAAAVYAASLLELAESAQQADAVGEELGELRNLWRDQASFAAIMSSAAIDDDTRALSIRKIFGQGRVSQLVFNFLMVLNRRRRSMLLPLVCEAYRQALDVHRRRTDVRVTSAVPLEDEQRNRLRGQLKRLIGLEPVLRERLDADMLGGMTVQVGDRFYDMSVRRRMRNLRSTLHGSLQTRLARGLGGTFVTG